MSISWILNEPPENRLLFNTIYTVIIQQNPDIPQYIQQYKERAYRRRYVRGGVSVAACAGAIGLAYCSSRQKVADLRAYVNINEKNQVDAAGIAEQFS